MSFSLFVSIALSFSLKGMKIKDGHREKNLNNRQNDEHKMCNNKPTESGIYIPSELAADQTLNWNEKAVYSIYHYFTFFGQSHCCRLTNETICSRLGLSERTLQRVKNDLKANNHITVNGITVKALIKYGGDRIVTHSENPEGVTELSPIANNTTGGDKVAPIIKRNIDVNKELLIDNSTIHNVNGDNVKTSRENEDNNCDCWMHDPQTDRPEYDPDETEQNTVNDGLQMCNERTTRCGSNNTDTKAMRTEFWGEWDAYKATIPSIDRDTAAQQYQTFQSRLAALYDGDKLTAMRENLKKQYNYLIETGNSTATKFEMPTEFQPPISTLDQLSTVTDAVDYYGQCVADYLNSIKAKPALTPYKERYMKWWVEDAVKYVVLNRGNIHTENEVKGIITKRWRTNNETIKNYFQSMTNTGGGATA